MTVTPRVETPFTAIPEERAACGHFGGPRLSEVPFVFARAAFRDSLDRRRAAAREAYHAADTRRRMASCLGRRLSVRVSSTPLMPPYYCAELPPRLHAGNFADVVSRHACGIVLRNLKETPAPSWLSTPGGGRTLRACEWGGGARPEGAGSPSWCRPACSRRCAACALSRGPSRASLRCARSIRFRPRLCALAAPAICCLPRARTAPRRRSPHSRATIAPACIDGYTRSSPIAAKEACASG